MNKDFNTLREALGIRYRNPYNARHTCATDWLERGVDLTVIADELGHSIQTLITRYARWINQDRKAAEHAKMEAEL